MRLNRVLLLAASFSILIFAMVFTISCSGDDGKNGKDGKGCTVEEDGKDYKILCGGDEVGVLKQGPKGDPGSATDKGDKGDQGPKGDKGDQGEQGPKGDSAPGAVENLCVLGPQNGSSFDIICGSTTIHPGTGVGSLNGCEVSQPDKYNPFQLQIKCAGSDPIQTCLNGGVFNPATYVCTNGEERTVDVSAKLYNYGTGVEAEITALKATGIKLRPGILLPLKDFTCNGVEYDPNKQFCQTTPSVKLVELCGAGDYSTSYFCFEGKSGYQKVVAKCGGSAGAGSTFNYRQFCQVPLTGVTVTGRAKGPYTDIKATVQPLCSGEWDVVDTDNNKEIITRSAGTYYEVTGTNENGIKISSADGFAGSALLYSFGSQSCSASGEVLTQCGDGTISTTNAVVKYNESTEFCRTNATSGSAQKVEKVDLCKEEGSVLAGKPYDGTTYFCATGVVSAKCGSVFYDGIKQFCDAASGKPADYCEDKSLRYNPDIRFCSFSEAGVSITQPYCQVGAEKRTYNTGFWKGEYCQHNGKSDAQAAYTLLTCGVSQQPDDGTDAAELKFGQCKYRDCVTSTTTGTYYPPLAASYGITANVASEGLIFPKTAGGFECKLGNIACTSTTTTPYIVLGNNGHKCASGADLSTLCDNTNNFAFKQANDPMKNVYRCAPKSSLAGATGALPSDLTCSDLWLLDSNKTITEAANRFVEAKCAASTACTDATIGSIPVLVGNNSQTSIFACKVKPDGTALTLTDITGSSFGPTRIEEQNACNSGNADTGALLIIGGSDLTKGVKCVAKTALADATLYAAIGSGGVAYKCASNKTYDHATGTCK